MSNLWPTGPNYKTKAVATAKFFFQHFQKVDTAGEDLLTQAQFNEAIKNITEDKSVNGGFDPEPPKWDDLEKDESGRIDLQEFTMACQQSWKNPPQH